MSIQVLLHRNSEIGSGKVFDIEGGLLHQLLHISFLEHSPANRRAVATLVASVVLDVEDGLRV